MPANPPTVASTLLSDLEEQRPLGAIALGVPVEPLKPISIPPTVPEAVRSAVVIQRDYMVGKLQDERVLLDRAEKTVAAGTEKVATIQAEVDALNQFLLAHAATAPISDAITAQAVALGWVAP